MKSLSTPGAAILLAFFTSVTARAEVDFNRQIRPILSDRCFHCHGPDAKNQKSDLRFDSEENALADLGGYFAIVPGDLEKSELHHRINTDDPDDVMPPPDSNRSLSKKEIALLDGWIRQGAPFDKHWAFKVPARPSLPKISQPDWPRNEIDHFILHRLDENGLAPSPEADRHTLLRRVTLDLTGLPPTPEEVDVFIRDKSPGAFERAVDRLLASPAYGERMALPWLDAARYADSAGYQNDFKRSQWPWRDWVVRAYNANMPFDRFSREQLAGDLLPDSTEDQVLATAFNRNHRINNEGGIIAEEFLNEYVADRVETTGTVWLGLTVGCARCHDHKYDPIAQKDFYRLFAFFHNIPEKGKDGAIAPEPNMAVYTSGSREEHDDLKESLAAAAESRKQHAKNAKAPLDSWIKSESARLRSAPGFLPLPAPILYFSFDSPRANRFDNLGSLPNPARITGQRRTILTNRPGRHGGGIYIRQGGYLNLGRPGRDAIAFVPNNPQSWAAWVKPGKDISGAEGPVLSCLTSDKTARGYQVNLVETGEDKYRVAFRLHSNRARKESIEVMSKETIPADKFAHIAVSYDGSMKASGVAIFIDGETAASDVVRDRFGAPFTTQEDLLLGAEIAASSAKTIRDELLSNTDVDELYICDETLDAGQVRAIYSTGTVDLLLSAPGKLSKGANAFLSNHYFEERDPAYKKLLATESRAEARLKTFEDGSITYVSIMKEMEEPRDTYFLVRGAYDAPDTSEKLLPGTPAALLPFEEKLPKNRLGLVEWLFSEENPLTARVAINRYWQMYFGAGLVKTSEDFGSQGEPPSHPQLLDWLAVEFRESGWDVKAMQKRIVTSAAYRQSSVVTPKLLACDPENRLLAHGPRFRLYAQALRDQVLAASGLLIDRPGGPPVMPYQPEGLWEEVSAKGFKYVEAEGEELYRRSLYTFWRRTVPPPSMMNFDTTAREICSVKSSRTNTPLQAMNLMNDPTYVEAARALAERMLTEGGEKTETQIRHGMKLLLGHPPEPAILAVLKRGHADYLARFRKNPDAAKEFIAVGKTPPDEALDAVQLAAHTAVASVMLNLDETVTKE